MGFQFLIGNLKTEKYALTVINVGDRFQFLIGNLKTVNILLVPYPL